MLEYPNSISKFSITILPGDQNDALSKGYCNGTSSLLIGKVSKSSGNEGPIHA